MKIVNSIEVNAAPEKVFCWVENRERARKWMTSVKKEEVINATPDMIGTTFREYIEENGSGIELEGVITEFVSKKRFAVHLESKMISVDASIDLEPKGKKTKVTQIADLHFKGILKMMSVFGRTSIKKKIMKQAKSELARLKGLCEQDG